MNRTMLLFWVEPNMDVLWIVFIGSDDDPRNDRSHHGHDARIFVMKMNQFLPSSASPTFSFSVQHISAPAMLCH